MNARHKGVGNVWLLNIVGNAALLAGIYFWLTLPDAHGGQVAASFVLAAAIVFCGIWLRAGTFAYFRAGDFRDQGTVWRAFRHALRHLVALVIWTIPLALLEWCLYSCLRYAPQFAVWWWQKLPALRFGSPRTVFHAAEWLLWIVMAMLVAVWLPLASTVAATGLKPTRMRRSLRLLGRGSYWLWFCVLMLAGALLPYKLVWWIPDFSTLTQQAWSAGLRFVVAYVLLVSAWVALLLVIGDRLTQEDPLAPKVMSQSP